MSHSPQIDVQDIDHLGIIAGIIDDIGIVEITDQLLGTHEQEQVTCGQVVKALILNCMGFLSAPLYLFSQFFQGKATQHLVAPGVCPEHLNDTRIGRVLDKLYRYGLSKLFVSIALQVVQKFKLLVDIVHLDSTSLSLKGQYIEQKDSHTTSNHEESFVCPPEPVPIQITHGYSKDHRPDLKQFMINLLTTEDAGIPLLLELGNGNDVDKTTFIPVIREFQKQWAEQLPEVIVADSALYSSDNIQSLGSTHWISLVPTTIGQAKDLLTSLTPEQFVCTGIKDYRCVQLCSTYGDIAQRWIVYENKARQNAQLKKLEQDIAKDFKRQEKLLTVLKLKDFACEADALNAAQSFRKTLKYHDLAEVKIIEKAHYSHAGRPRKDASASHYSYNIRGSLQVNEKVIEARKRQAGRFILATNLEDHNLWNQKQILKTYKQQQCCERGFRFLKDPLFFASSIFLKTPRRIMALAMIMCLCLMVYSLGQRELRKSLENSKGTLANQKGQQIERPSLRWILQCFLSVHLVWVDGHKYLIKLNQRQKQIFTFLSPACQKYYLLS